MRSSLGRLLITFLIRKAQCGHVYAAVLSNDTIASNATRLWWCALHMAGQLFPISHTMYLQTTYVYPALSSQELAGSNIKVCSYGRQPLSPIVLSELNGCEATN